MTKTLRFALALWFLSAPVMATMHQIGTAGLAYTPSMTMAQQGDTILLDADFSFHPTIQVSRATWTANGSTPMVGGFQYTNGAVPFVTFVLTAAEDVYYVCRNHVGSGMKGSIMVSPATALRLSLTSADLYPNPARDAVTLPAGLPGGEATIATATGQTVQAYTLAPGQRSLPLGSLAPGSYLLSMPGRRYRLIKE